jgi:hypothetical protein
MEIQNFNRKSFTVQGVQVTAENMAEVAEWCGGTVQDVEGREGEQYIHVNVLRPINERQEKAFVGDHVLSSKNGFKVYNDPAFRKNFEDGVGSTEFVSGSVNVFNRPQGVSAEALQELATAFSPERLLHQHNTNEAIRKIRGSSGPRRIG